MATVLERLKKWWGGRNRLTANTGPGSKVQMSISVSDSPRTLATLARLTNENRVLRALVDSSRLRGEVVLTHNRKEELVMVSRQDPDGNILSVLWEAPTRARSKKRKSTPRRQR